MSEYLAFILFALSGMMFASSANDFSLLFVAIELITVTFYILVSFQRHRMHSLEAGVKYLILGAVSSAFLVYGIALVFGEAGSLKFDAIRDAHAGLLESKVFLFGMLFVFAGLAFQDFRIPVPGVGTGCVSGRAHAHDDVPCGRLQGGRLCAANSPVSAALSRN